MKTNNVGLDNGYAIVRGWVGSLGAGPDPGTAEDLVTDETDTTTRLAPDGTGGTEWRQVDVDELATSETDTTLRAAPDGLGGVEFVAGLTVEDEGGPLATAADTLNFVGAGVTASGTGAAKTITIPGAAAGNDIKGNEVTPPLSIALPAWAKPTGSGVITADPQGRITVVNSTTYKAFPGMCFLEGRLHLLYRDGSAHNSAGGVIKYAYSDTLGRTWSTPATIASPAGSEDLRDPCVTALSTGRLLLSYHVATTGGTVAVRVERIYSDNRGQSWSSLYVIPDTFSGRVAASSPPLELPDGTILQAGYGENGGNFLAVVWFSTDGGLTFGTQTTIASSGSRDYDEPQLRLLASGKIVCLLRTDTSPNHTWRTVSTDGGLTWSAAADVLSYGKGRPDFAEFYPGALLLVTRNDGTDNDGRWFVSWDEGLTWTAPQELDSGVTTDELYAGIVVLAPGYIAVAYSLENSSSDADIYLRYFYNGYGTDPLGNVRALIGGALISTTAPTSGQVLTASSTSAAAWATPSAGTVSSVGLTVPAEFAVSGSPVTSSGTLAITSANESANTVWAGPTSGAATTPAFRALVAADIPSGVGQTDHEHIGNIQYNGDGSTVTFELPAAPFDAYSVIASVAGVIQDVVLSGTMLTTMTFASAPGSGTNNVRADITAIAA